MSKYGQIAVVATGNFPVNGGTQRCEVIRIGSTLRIINIKTNRSISSKGYEDMSEIRKDYPGTV